MERCKVGDTVTGPSCKKTTKVVMKGQRNDPSSHPEVVYVNDQDEECAFIAKAPGGFKTLTGEAQFDQLKAGDKVASVCAVCKTVTQIAVESHEHALGFYKEGAMVTCPSCKKTTQVGRKEKRNDPPFYSEVIYVNEKGEDADQRLFLLTDHARNNLLISARGGGRELLALDRRPCPAGWGRAGRYGTPSSRFIAPPIASPMR